MNLYPPILYESAWAASIIPFGSDPTFFAMKDFGGYNMTLAFALAVAGGTMGQIFNWLFGYALRKLPITAQPPRWYPKLQPLFNRYGIFLLLFAWMPLFNILPVAVGFFGGRARIALPLLFLGEVAYYGWYLIPA